jgi:hypothetical protein
VPIFDERAELLAWPNKARLPHATGQ